MHARMVVAVQGLFCTVSWLVRGIRLRTWDPALAGFAQRFYCSVKLTVTFISTSTGTPLSSVGSYCH